MTFCLARPNAWTVIVAALAVVTIVVSCEHPVTDPSSSIAQLVVSPQNVTLQQNQAEDFLAVGFTASGDSADIAVSWSATGGSIDSSSAGKRHYGHYTSATWRLHGHGDQPPGERLHGGERHGDRVPAA